MIKHDGHLAAKILLRERSKAARRITGKREIHDPLARVVAVAVFCRAAEVPAGNYSRATKDVPPLTIWRTPGSRAFRTSGDKLGTGRQHPAMLAQCIGL